MRDKLEQIFNKHHEGYAVYNKDEIIKEVLALFYIPVVGQSEEFYCDGQENNKDRCKTQCLGCAGMQEIYGQ